MPSRSEFGLPKEWRTGDVFENLKCWLAQNEIPYTRIFTADLLLKNFYQNFPITAHNDFGQVGVRGLPIEHGGVYIKLLYIWQDYSVNSVQRLNDLNNIFYDYVINIMEQEEHVFTGEPDVLLSLDHRAYKDIAQDGFPDFFRRYCFETDSEDIGILNSGKTFYSLT